MSNSEVEAAVHALIAINPDYSREALFKMAPGRLEELIEERLQEAIETQLEERRLRMLSTQMQHLRASGD